VDQVIITMQMGGFRTTRIMESIELIGKEVDPELR